MRMRERSTVAAMTVALVVLAIAGVAHAAIRSGNPGPFPDTCDISGFSQWEIMAPGYNDWALAQTDEQKNCARLEAKLRYRNTSGVWVTASSGWKFASSASTGVRFTNVAPAYSDHNGDNNDSGTTYGFRVNW